MSPLDFAYLSCCSYTDNGCLSISLVDLGGETVSPPDFISSEVLKRGSF
jgi:hypothetical protein